MTRPGKSKRVLCGCYYCIPGKLKKVLLKERALDKELRDAKRGLER